ncbi:hypothetical protein F4806DRAFT_492061 [Annulohypoxylon nitens]|nr:hypothetical protein F4806DRAFT_492061 [Annulohypoxylon nitens]
MFEKYGFEASQSQYERQVRKWNLKKTHTGEEWAALSTICRNRIGKGSEMYYRGKLIDAQRAQRALWRHGYVSTIERITKVDDPPTPSGFIVRTPTPENFREQSEEWCSKLPFAQVMNFVWKAHVHDLFIPRSLNPQLLTTQYPVIWYPSSTESSGYRKVLQKSQGDVISRTARSIIPTSMLQPYLNKSHSDLASMIAIFFLSNGIENADDRYIWNFLGTSPANLMRHFIQSTTGPTSKEISKKLFDLAIKFGDAEVVAFIIAHKSLGIDINEHVCTHFSHQCTPLELSLARRQYVVTHVLFENGASINADRNSALLYAFSYPIDVPYTSFSLKDEPRDPPGDLIDLLVEKWSPIDKHLMLQALEVTKQPQTSLSSARSHLVLRFFNASTNSHAEFWRAGVFHYAMSKATREVVGDIFQMVYNINKNVDAVYDDMEMPVSTDPFAISIMDSLAKQGQLRLVQQLHAAGCRIREHTLIYAIQSQQMQLVQFLLEKGARVDSSKQGFSAVSLRPKELTDSENVIETQLITPYSEAIRIGNEELCAQLILEGALQDDPRQLVAALHAFAETRNFQMQDQLLRSIESLNIKQLTKNQLDLDQLHIAVYHCLVEALWQGNNDIAQLSFDVWFELIPISIQPDRSRYTSGLERRNNYAAFAFSLSLEKRNHQIAHLFLQLDAQFLKPDFSRIYEKRLAYNGYIMNEDPLCQALRWGDESIFKDLLFCMGAYSSPVVPPYDVPKSLFDIAIGKEDLAILKYLIESGFHVRGGNLATAVRTGNLEIVSFLLERGASPDETAFVDAVDQGTDMINLLLGSLAQKAQQVSSCALHIPAEQAMSKLIRRNDVHLVRRLLQHGVGIDSSSILVAATVNPEMLDLLLEVVDERYSEDRWSAAHNVELETFPHDDIDYSSRYVYSDYSDHSDHSDHSDDIDDIDDSDDNDFVRPEIPWEMRVGRAEVLPLSVAIDKDQTHEQQILRAILESGASKQLNDVIYKSCSGAVQETALLRAVGRQNLAVLGLLVDSGADVNLFAAPKVRRTPLQKASELGAFEVVQFLLDRGADVNGFAGIVALLLTKGADINAKAARMHGRTALEGAAENGRLDTVTLLLQAGVRITGDGRRQFEKAMLFAEREQHYNVLKILESHDTMTQIPSPLNSEVEHDQEQDQDDWIRRDFLELSPTPSV